MRIQDRAGFDCRNLLYAYYKANTALNVNTAVSDRNFEKYKVVYMPAHNIVTKEQSERISDYVKNGGTLVLTFRIGTRDEYNNVRPMVVPGLFADMAGIEVEEFDAPRDEVRITGKINGQAKLWCDIIRPYSAEVISVYDSEYYRGNAAITLNSYGKGRVYYIGCDLDEVAMKALVGHISEESGVNTIKLPDGIELVRRGECVFLLNHNESEVKVEIEGGNALTGKVFDGRLEGYGAYVLIDKKEI